MSLLILIALVIVVLAFFLSCKHFELILHPICYAYHFLCLNVLSLLVCLPFITPALILLLSPQKGPSWLS